MQLKSRLIRAGDAFQIPYCAILLTLFELCVLPHCDAQFVMSARLQSKCCHVIDLLDICVNNKEIKPYMFPAYRITAVKLNKWFTFMDLLQSYMRQIGKDWWRRWWATASSHSASHTPHNWSWKCPKCLSLIAYRFFINKANKAERVWQRFRSLMRRV